MSIRKLLTACKFSVLCWLEVTIWKNDLQYSKLIKVLYYYHLNIWTICTKHSKMSGTLTDTLSCVFTQRRKTANTKDKLD